ncbi:MAG TPA: radical SAM protein, partial [Bryobacteraceae bacterium]|nr:radical SAM protein [Bryobacteraceae bacterium]
MVPAPSTAPERTPMLLYFKTAEANYVYDAPTNEILQVSRDFWETTQQADWWRGEGPDRGELSQATPSEQALLDEIDAARDTGLFSGQRPKSLSLMITKDEFKKSLDSKVSQLILGVTEQCNLRCAYCTYSGQYQDQRTHANNWMPVELAQDATRFFLARNRESDATYVSFYGGEPTLNMEAIRAAVALVEDNAKRPARFSLTTNAYSLSDETLRYFVDHSFFVLASIDGPAAVHNRFRKTAGGQDTFAAVYRTLERLRAMDESFFKANVRVSAVIGPPYDIRLLKEFFDTDPLFEGTSMRASTISESSTTFFDNLKPDADITPRPGADFASM